MFGWIATTENLSNMDAACIENTQLSKIGKYTFIMNNNRRFPKDVVFLETEKYFYLIDGVVLNRVELEEEYGCEFKDVVQKLYAEGGDLLPGSLRGCFTGCVLDKESEELFAFTNQTADGGLFYSTDKKIFGNNFEWILHVLRAVGAEVSLDEQAVLYMCTFGYMLDSTTYAKNVKRAMPGECFKLADSLEKHYYHKFDNTKTINMTEQEYIEHIDFLYRRAIKREFDKDAEYGYTSIVDLSGGLDCRMINYVAKSMGYKNIVNVSFSQVYSDEYKAMIELSRNLGFRLFHYPLDNARHLFDVDKITKHNYGLSIYSGAGAMMSVMENLSFSYYGLEHGGIMGDMAEGIFPGGEYTEHVAPTFEEGMPICRILGFDDLDPAVLEEFPNLELFTVRGRGLLAAGSTQLVRRFFTGYASPYEDVDFYELFMAMPLEVRGKGEILRKWAMQKYPESFNIVEDSLMCKPNASHLTRKWCVIKRKIKAKLGSYFPNLFKNLAMNSMNPIAYWYEHNAEFKAFVEDYYQENIGRIAEGTKAREWVSTVYEKGNITEKLAALTVLSTVKNFEL